MLTTIALLGALAVAADAPTPEGCDLDLDGPVTATMTTLYVGRTPVEVRGREARTWAAQRLQACDLGHAVPSLEKWRSHRRCVNWTAGVGVALFWPALIGTAICGPAAGDARLLTVQQLSTR